MVQQQMLARVFGCCRVVFNDALSVRDEAYRAGVKLSDSEIQRRVVTQAKRTAERGWLAEVPSVALVQSVNDSRRAWRNFFDSKTGRRQGIRVGRPRMKSRKDHRQSFRLTRNGFSVRPNGRLFLAKIGEVQVRWSRKLPSEPSSATIIREPDGHYDASFVVDVAPTPLPATDTEAGVDVGIARLATVAGSGGQRKDIVKPQAFGSQDAQAAAVGAGEVWPAERISEEEQDATQNRYRVRTGGAGATGLSTLSTQAGVVVGARKPSAPRRGSHHCGHGRQSSARTGHQRCGLGALRTNPYRKGGPLRAERAYRVAVAGVDQDLLDLWAPNRRAALANKVMDVPGVPGGSRSRSQCRQSHSRRRAGGETKRLPLQWAEPRERFGGAHVRPQPVAALGDEAGSNPAAA